jgi:glycosyltransferase involved in cell wall biosynthesis
LKVSVIIPAYNEENRIINRIESLVKYFDRMLEEYELLIIADGCTDKTPEVVSEYANDNPKVKLLNFLERLGKGGAIVEGMKRAKGDVVVIADADDSVPPRELFKLIVETRDHDVVIGSRYAKDSRLLVREPFLRYFLGRGFNALAKLMFWSLRGISDTQCGAKALKRQVVENILREFFITGFAVDVNLLYSATRRGFRIKEVGVEYRHVERESKVSRALMKLVLGMFFSLAKLRLYYSRLRPILDARAMERLSALLWRLTKA